MSKITFTALQNPHVSTVIRGMMTLWVHLKSLFIRTEGNTVIMRFSFKAQDGLCMRQTEVIFTDVFSTSDPTVLGPIEHLIESKKAAKTFCNKLAQQCSFEIPQSETSGSSESKYGGDQGGQGGESKYEGKYEDAASEFEMILSTPALTELVRYAEVAGIPGLDIRIDEAKVTLGVGENNTIEERGSGDLEFKGVPITPHYKEAFHTPTRLLQIATVLFCRFNLPISFSRPHNHLLTKAAIEIAEQGIIAMSVDFY